MALIGSLACQSRGTLISTPENRHVTGRKAPGVSREAPGGNTPGHVGKLARWLCTYPKEKSGFVRFSEHKKVCLITVNLPYDFGNSTERQSWADIGAADVQ